MADVAVQTVEAKPSLPQETPGFSPPENSIASFLKRMGPIDNDSSEVTPVDPPSSDDEISEKSSEPKEAEKSAKEPTLPKVETLQSLAKEGKFAEVLEALGVEVDGTKIPADRFAKFRRMQKAEKAKLDQRAAQITAKEAQVQQQINAVLKDFDGFAKAKKAWDDGDIVGAIEAAFGEPLESISDKALKQKLSSDPELHKLRRKLEAKEKAEKEAQERYQQQRAQQAQQAEVTKYVADLTEALKASDDAEIAKAATHKDFARFVYNAQLHAYHTKGVELSQEEAAEQVLETIRADYQAWSDLLNGSGSQNSVDSRPLARQAEITTQAGKSPEKPRKGPKGVSLVRATATPVKAPAEMTSEELLAYYKKELARVAREEQATG
jgi:hypothetical protein